MRKLGTVLSIMAVANMLALAGLALWLKATDRLNVERLRAVRDVLRPTIAEEHDARKKEEERLAREQAEAEERDRLERPALTAEQQLAIRLASTEAEWQRRQRFEREVADLRTALDRERAEFEAERASIESARAAAQAEAEARAEVTSSEQFRKAVGVLEAMKAPEAKAALLEVMRMGPATAIGSLSAGVGSADDFSEEGLSRAVLYLDSLQERTRAKVLSEFLKDDPKLAATLLERIRTLGAATPPPLSGREASPGL